MKDPDLNTLMELASEVRIIQDQGIAQFTPVVNRIINEGSRDFQHIEHTLDYLLDFACTPDGLALFKSLCRYYYDLNPNSSAAYVRDYFEMWEPEKLGKKG